MVLFSNDSVIRLRVVTVSLVHTIDWTRVARVIISVGRFSFLALQILFIFQVNVIVRKCVLRPRNRSIAVDNSERIVV